ncbi:hypothetical protein [Polaribacter sp.]|uniref:hypothetical protein n=1 Tax=Polaribacter sp. TaxID=1920175 RepID=UPI004048E5B8
MKFFYYCTYLIALMLIISCNSAGDDCTKTIIIQPELTISTQTGTSYIPQVTQIVPCSFSEPEIAKSLEGLPKLSEFSYEILEFNFIPDTGNNTGKIQFKIKLNNLSSYKVKGFPYVTNDIGGGFTASKAFDSCKEIQAKSSCTFEFNQEYALDSNLGVINNYNIVNVEYLLIQ